MHIPKTGGTSIDAAGMHETTPVPWRGKEIRRCGVCLCIFGFVLCGSTVFNFLKVCVSCFCSVRSRRSGFGLSVQL